MLRMKFKYWEILRQCCGDQSSKYHMAALNGCDMTPYLQDPANPMCERHNMSFIEEEYCKYESCNNKPSRTDTTWRGPGDCARIDKLIAKESLGFISRPFQGCENLRDRSEA